MCTRTQSRRLGPVPGCPYRWARLASSSVRRGETDAPLMLNPEAVVMGGRRGWASTASPAFCRDGATKMDLTLQPDVQTLRDVSEPDPEASRVIAPAPYSVRSAINGSTRESCRTAPRGSLTDITPPRRSDADVRRVPRKHPAQRERRPRAGS